MDSYLLFSWAVLLTLLWVLSALVVWAVVYLGRLIVWAWRLK